MSYHPHHLSDILTFSKCEQLWEFTSHHRRNLQPQILPYPLFLGIAAHIYFEHLNRDPSLALEKYLNQELESSRYYVSTGYDVHNMFHSYDLLDRYMAWPSENFEVLYTEYPAMFSIYGFPFKTRFDRIIRERSSGVWYIEDLKTTSNIDKSMRNILYNDLQAHMLHYAFQENFKEEQFGGTIYTFLNSRPYKYAKILDNGMLSQDLSIWSYDLVYLEQAAHLHGVSQEEVKPFYKDILNMLRPNRNEFLQRMTFIPNKIRQENALRVITKQAARMRMLMNGVDALPTGMGIYGMCDSCPFFNPCYASREGRTPDLNDYKYREGYIR